MVVYEGVVDSGFKYLISRFTGLPYPGVGESNLVSCIGFGAGDSPWSATDTALEIPHTTGGLEYQVCTVEYLNTTDHPETTHIYGTITNTSSGDLYIGEAGLYTAAGDLVARKVFLPNELQNEGYLPPGDSVEAHWYLAFEYGSFIEHDPPLVGGAISMSVAATFEIVLDPSLFATRFPLCFNGYEIPGAGIVSISEGRGGRTWSLTSTTTDYSKVTALMRLAGSVSVGVSVSGDSYVTSLRRSGTFAVQHDYKTWVKYNDCYLVAPIVVETFGLNYWMTITIVQSAYGDLS